jgi:NADH dehydrogenase
LIGYDDFYFRLAKVKRVSPTKKTIKTSIGELSYDYLVLATGSVTNFFGNVEIEKNAMAMKSIPQSLNLRSLILENLEQALLTDDYHERDALMNFVIVGGGPTGVELAGALAEIKRGILPKDYPDLDTRRAQINIVQGGELLLEGMSAEASKKAEDFLEELGVQVWKGVRVTGYNGKTVTTKTDLVFESAAVVWAAGVKGASIKGLDTAELITHGNRLNVNEFNQVIDYPEIFAIGDIACMVNDDHPRGHPMVAQTAIQQGKLLGDNLINFIEHKPMKPFEYKDKGSMATVGRNKAVCDVKGYRFQGVFAWFIWMFVHLFFLIGFRNKMVVFINWVYNYIRFDREARLIIRPYKRDYSQFKD